MVEANKSIWEKKGEEFKKPQNGEVVGLNKVQFRNVNFVPFSQAAEKRGLKIGIWGGYSSGKTHFALTAPEPIYIIDTELGSVPLKDMFPNKEIYVIDVLGKDEVESFENVVNAIEKLEKIEKIGTLVIDSISDIWSWAQVYCKVKVWKKAPEDRLNQQWDWGVINSHYNRIFRELIRKNCNVIATARESEVYISAGQPSGRYEPKWQKETGFLMDFVLNSRFEMPNYKITIDKCRGIPKFEGKSFVNMDFSKFVEETKKAKELYMKLLIKPEVKNG